VLGGYELDECVGHVEADDGAVGMGGGIALAHEQWLVAEQARPGAICENACGLDHGAIHRRLRPAPVLVMKGRAQVVFGKWIGLPGRDWVGERQAP
jgi:hypothetical protein